MACATSISAHSARAGSSLPATQAPGGRELAHGRDVHQRQGTVEVYRAVDKAGHTVDFLLTAKRDRKAAARFLRKAIDQCGTPEKITIDKSGANTAAIEEYNSDNEASIELRQVKYLNNVVEQDHRAIKRLTRPMLGFESFWSAAITLAGIELMHMIRKGPTEGPRQIASSAAILFVGCLSRFLIADPVPPFRNFATEPDCEFATHRPEEVG